MLHQQANNHMKFIVGMVIINWRVWFVPDFDFEKLEGMAESQSPLWS